MTVLSVYVLFLQYGEESSKTIMNCRESDYAGQYSPWSCETIGSYIGSKDAKPKDVMVPGTMEMMVSSDASSELCEKLCQYFPIRDGEMMHRDAVSNDSVLTLKTCNS